VDYWNAIGRKARMQLPLLWTCSAAQSLHAARWSSTDASSRRQLGPRANHAIKVTPRALAPIQDSGDETTTSFVPLLPLPDSIRGSDSSIEQTLARLIFRLQVHAPPLTSHQHLIRAVRRVRRMSRKLAFEFIVPSCFFCSLPTPSLCDFTFSCLGFRLEQPSLNNASCTPQFPSTLQAA